MTKTDLMKLANEVSPELMQKTAANLHELSNVSSELARDSAGEMALILDHAGSKTKEAAPAWASALGRGAADIGVAAAKGVGATIVAGLGMAVATDLYNASRRGLTAGRNWKRMMASNPALKEHDQAEVRRAFKMVQQHAPDVASDPMAAGSLVFNVVSSGDTPGTMHAHLSTMVKAQREKAESMYAPFHGTPKPIFTKEEKESKK